MRGRWTRPSPPCFLGCAMGGLAWSIGDAASSSCWVDGWMGCTRTIRRFVSFTGLGWWLSWWWVYKLDRMYVHGPFLFFSPPVRFVFDCCAAGRGEGE